MKFKQLIESIERKITVSKTPKNFYVVYFVKPERTDEIEKYEKELKGIRDAYYYLNIYPEIAKNADKKDLENLESKRDSLHKKISELEEDKLVKLAVPGYEIELNPGIKNHEFFIVKSKLHIEKLGYKENILLFDKKTGGFVDRSKTIKSLNFFKNENFVKNFISRYLEVVKILKNNKIDYPVN